MRPMKPAAADMRGRSHNSISDGASPHRLSLEPQTGNIVIAGYGSLINRISFATLDVGNVGPSFSDRRWPRAPVASCPREEGLSMRSIPIGAKGTFEAIVRREDLASTFKDASLPPRLEKVINSLSGPST